MAVVKCCHGIGQVILAAIMQEGFSQKSVNEICDQRECNITAGLQCIDEICQCLSGQMLPWGDCGKLIDEPCDEDAWECAYTLGLDCSNSRCICKYSNNINGCPMAYSQACDDDVICDDSMGLQCLDGVCGCPNSEKFKNGRCGKVYNEECLEGECASSLGLQCLNGKCQCLDTLWYNNGVCGGGVRYYGQSCEWGQCYRPHGLTCLDYECQCLSGSKDSTGACKKLAGDTCSDGECSDLLNLKCTEGKCVCQRESCLKGVWENCTSTTECVDFMGLDCRISWDSNTTCQCPQDIKFHSSVCNPK